MNGSTLANLSQSRPLFAKKFKPAPEEDSSDKRTARQVPNFPENQAIVSDTIRPHRPGRVRYQGSWYPAICQSNVVLEPGTIVLVVGRRNITLLVQPIGLN